MSGQRTDSRAGGAGGRWQRRADVLWRSLPVGVIVLPRNGTEPFVLTGTGPDLWVLLDQPRTLGELADELARRYDTPAAVIEVDLLPTLASLEDRAVVECQG